MNKEFLTKGLEGLSAATPKATALLKELFVRMVFKKGMLLSVSDQAFPTLYFMEPGLVRSYFYYHQEEYTCCLAEEGFLLPSRSFYRGEPVVEYIHFGQDAVGWLLNLTQAEALAHREPVVYRMLLEIYDRDRQEGKHREMMLRLKHAEDRFLYDQRFGRGLARKFINRVSGSFLNMKERYFSSIKNKYAK